ncbi:MAG: hypothetical protein Q7T89_10030 [Anaerolineales bacterium]|nr:hypothetical protein [Anaerolineales bacterium]
MAEPLYFQWQNEILCKTIYPMREPKLRDFLVYYTEIDLWKQYKDKDIATLKPDVDAYTKAQEMAAITAYKSYSSLRDYFMQKDVRGYYLKLKPVDEAELTEINNFHALFIESWPKDIRGERSFVESQIQYWVNHRNMHREAVKSKKRRVENMDPAHPKRPVEMQELAAKENVTLPMAEQELDQLRAFLKTYDKIEQRKLAWYKLSKADPAFSTSEAEFLVQYKPQNPVTVRDIAVWKAEEYKSSLEKKNQYELLEEAYQRFKKEPKRFPFWLQYMAVHFSGMRYASAHGSWADPKDLLIRLGAADVDKKAKALDDAAVEKLCAEKIAAYEAGKGSNVPGLARAAEKEWKDKAAMHMLSVKANGPKTRRAGINALLVEEANYDIRSLSTEDALKKLEAMKNTFPKWAWKEIVKLTPLRINHVTDPNWEKLTPEEDAERNSQAAMEIRTLMDAWENYDSSAWRDEHGRTHELIVSRAVCNETAEHCQHIRGNLPPGGLTPKPKWYFTHEAENKLPGEIRPFYTKPTSEKDYVQGASIFWLRFVDKEPNAWQIAKAVKTKSGVGLLPNVSAEKKKADPKSGTTPWAYQQGDSATRSRTVENPETKVKVQQKQWLRWIHEATVAEIAETADGMTVITYETALPDGDKGVSAIGVFKMPLEWHLSDGPEDTYNRAFVGYVPEGQAPLEHLKTMLDWNKILRKKVV